jgi:hypothetical protein
MTATESQPDLRDDYLAVPRHVPRLPNLKSAAILVALLACAAGFSALFHTASTNVSEGGQPPIAVVGP